MDRDASLSSGGYAYIDSSYPRRPGDVARLVSVGLPASAPDAPTCMHFSFHMFGSGIGELKLSLRHARNLESQQQVIWRLRGNAGNSWFDSRVTVSSLDDYQLVFEATVGNTGMGDIAIDDVSFSTGACPSQFTLYTYIYMSNSIGIRHFERHMTCETSFFFLLWSLFCSFLRQMGNWPASFFVNNNFIYRECLKIIPSGSESPIPFEKRK